MSEIDPTLDNESEGIKALRADRDAKAAEAAEGRAAKRELAMLKAGVDTESKVGQMFAAMYDGALDDPAAIKAAWDDLGVGAPAPPAEPTVNDEPPPGPTESQSRRLIAAGDGMDPQLPGEPKPPSMDDIYEDYNNLIKDGSTKEDASIAVFGQIFQQAAAGNGEYLWDEKARDAHRQAASRIGS